MLIQQMIDQSGGGGNITHVGITLDAYLQLTPEQKADPSTFWVVLPN